MKKKIIKTIMVLGVLATSTSVFAANGTWSTKYAEFSGYLYKGVSSKTVVNHWYSGSNVSTDPAYVYLELVNRDGSVKWSNDRYGNSTAYLEKVASSYKAHSAHSTARSSNYPLWIYN